MPIFEYICECGVHVERIVGHSEVDNQKCPVCKKHMRKQFPNTMNFKLIYNNKTDMCSWGHEGYARSQYWDKIKEQRTKDGKIQVPVTENIK